MDPVNTVPVECIYLIAEHRLLRESLVRLLRKKTDLQVVGESRLFDSSVQQVIESKCQVLLLDSPAPKFLLELAEKAPHIKTVLFGMDEAPDVFLKAVQLGVSGYVVKEASAGDIVAAVRGVVQGNAVCSPSLCMSLFQHVAAEYRKRPANADREARVKFGLTHRQNQLLALVARGLTNKEIAANLNLSEFTVKNHLSRILKQVDVENRHEAVDLMRESGCLPAV
jgi:DNA-binding NarL/FixJ family response regulator